MKLLIITQKVNQNDPILGFFHRWIEEFAMHVEQLTVICLEEGVHNLPSNVRVLSLGKEKGVNKVGQLLNLYRYVWQHRDSYDRVFVHMNPLYILLCGVLWVCIQKPIFLWYTHKTVDMKLRLASVFVQKIFTASDKSLRLNTHKKVVTGHGVDVHFFCPDSDSIKKQNTILTVSRISKTKNIHTIIDILAQLPEYTLHIIGDAVTEADKQYLDQCRDKIKTMGVIDRVIWHGAVTHQDTRFFYRTIPLFINLSETGSLDKVIIEAMACGATVISSNEAVANVDEIVYIEAPIQVDVAAEKIRSIHNLQTPAFSFVQRHSLPALIHRIIEKMA